MDAQLHFLTQARLLLVDLAIHFGPKVLGALAILAVGAIAGRWAERSMLRLFARMELEPPVRQLLARIVWLAVFGMFLIMALQNMGVQLMPVLAGLGVAGAGIALATQGVLSNVVAGLSIIFTKPYRVGEYIGIVGVEGEVQAISLFSTTLLHADRSRVVVPNRKIVGEILHNYGRIRQLELRVGIEYGTDLARALAAAREVVAGESRVLHDPAPLIQVAELGDSAVVLVIRPWVSVADFGPMTGVLNVALLDALSRHGIGIAYPQRHVRLLEGR